MRRITLILPVYNDWESLRLLLNKIKKKIKKKIICNVLIINDNSHSNQLERLDKENVYNNINIINNNIIQNFNNLHMNIYNQINNNIINNQNNHLNNINNNNNLNYIAQN